MSYPEHISTTTSRVLAVADWSNVGDRAHVVQFYEEDAFLIELLSRFIGTALVSGDSAVVIVTKEHREELARCLKSRGLDIEIARLQGRFIPLDAAETLKVSSDGFPETGRFQNVVGGAMESAAKVAGSRRRVAAFSEVVGVLWMSGKHEAAIRLEELWSRMVASLPISLCCGYPMKAFNSPLHAAPFVKICAQHTHVFRTEGQRPAIAADSSR